MKRLCLYSIGALFVIFLSLVFFNCNDSIDVIQIEKNGIYYHLELIPNQFLIEKEFLDSKEDLNLIKEKYRGHAYLKLTINSVGGVNILDFLKKKFGEKAAEKKLRILSFHSTKDLKLISSKYEKSCVLYHLDRTMVEVKGLEMMVVFNVEDIDDLDNEQFVFEFDAKIFEEGLISFELPQSIVDQLI